MGLSSDEVAYRQGRLQALVDEKFGGDKAAAGRALGFKSGSYVGQLLSGHRPISEKLVARIEGMKGCRGWFGDRRLLGVDALDTDVKLVEGKLVHVPKIDELVEHLGRVMQPLPGVTRRALWSLLEGMVAEPHRAPEWAAQARALVDAALGNGHTPSGRAAAA